MKTEVKEIPFNGSTLLGVRDESGKIYLAVRKACNDIGLTDAQGRAEVSKLQSSILFKSNCLKFKTVQTEGNREVKREILVLAEKFVPMWLAQINITPAMQKKNPLASFKLLKYQLEAADVLHKAFYETEEQKEALHDSMGLEGEIATLNQKVDTLTETVHDLLDYSTINKVQQNTLYNLAKERVCFLLGGKNSAAYKMYHKLYFQNLWGDVKRKFDCSGSYHDLNPRDYGAAKEFIPEWNYEG